jgi:hypothetical protein
MPVGTIAFAVWAVHGRQMRGYELPVSALSASRRNEVHSARLADPAFDRLRAPVTGHEGITELDRAVGRLIHQVAHWSPARWRRSGAAETVFSLVQTLAALSAEALGEPRRTVPRLDNDLALPDQVRVLAAELRDADPDPTQVTAALAAVRAARVALMPTASG